MNNQENQIKRKSAEANDGVVAAPAHHKIIFENERVRVLDVRVAPGAIVPAHTHQWASVNYVLSFSDFLRFDADGNVDLDSRTADTGFGEGAVKWLSANPPLHSVKNIGDREIRAISVELKDQRFGSNSDQTAICEKNRQRTD